jgi:sugar O-acyltransferase (sialic acid O-acetyltransferase NeuD family)
VTLGPLVVVGAGGHAKVVISTARAIGFTAVRVVDDNPSTWGTKLLGAAVEDGVSHALADPNALVVFAIGSNQTRAERSRDARCQFGVLVHPFSFIDSTARIGPGTVVFAGGVVQPDAVLGEHVIVNTSASIDHDCHIGACSHLAPGSRLAGNVVLDKGVFIGAGAVVIPSVHVGAFAIVGAGAAVIRNVPEHTTVFGVPARVGSRSS